MVARVERFEDLEVWRKARELTNVIYQGTASGNFSRDFGLRDQLRRAGVSIISEVSRLISGLMKYLQTSTLRGNKYK
jgi:hypothetical protein